ncbi:MAG: AsmA-like C-terminal domain-containing protein, partial [Robiginitomaculum sp.]
PGGLSGTANMKKFKVVDAPVFARILSLASLQGLGEILSGDGMNFDTLTAPFEFEDGLLMLGESRANGSAIGLTARGSIDFDEKAMDLDGVIVPAYTLNSVLGKVPILGDIVVGKEGEGIFALNYSLDGPFHKTQVSVNPLSAFTPGFLRQIFQPTKQKPLRKPAEGEAENTP